MASALQLLTRALRLIRVVASGETLAAHEAQDALVALNGMLSAWRLDSLMVYAIDRQVFTLVVNQGAYTIGVGGDWNTPRPVRIERAGFVTDATLPTEGESPLQVLTDEQYQEIWLRRLTSVWAYWLYYDRAYPLGTVMVYPTPTVARQVALYLWHPLPQVPTLTTTIDFPPAYEEALTWNVAVRIAPEYGVPVSPDVREMARESKAIIELQNFQVPVAQFAQGLGRWAGAAGEWGLGG